jgi:hypothetical protein
VPDGSNPDSHFTSRDSFEHPQTAVKTLNVLAVPLAVGALCGKSDMQINLIYQVF